VAQDFVLPLQLILYTTSPRCPLPAPPGVSPWGPFPPNGQSDANNQVPVHDGANPYVPTEFVLDPLGRIIRTYGPFVKQYSGDTRDYSFPARWCASPNYPPHPVMSAAVVTSQACGVIKVRQVSGPQTMFQITDAANPNSPVLVKAGGEYTFQGPYSANAAAGTVAALEASPDTPILFSVAQR
jgi:hypothetical protein